MDSSNVTSPNVTSSNMTSFNDTSSERTSSNATSSNDAPSNDSSSNDSSSNDTSFNDTSSNGTSSNGTVRPSLPPAWAFKATPPLLAYGAPFSQLVRTHMTTTFSASPAYVIVSASLSRQTDKLEELKTVLGDDLAGVRVGMKPHTFMSEVLEIIEDVRRVGAGIIITLGGGTLSDAAKMVSFGLANNVTSIEDMRRLPDHTAPNKPATASKVPIICVPTTLSAGEFTNYAGVTDDADKVKKQYCDPLKGPAMVILDGEVAVTTPLKIWLSSGIRSIDHYVECLVSPSPPTGRIKEGDEAALEGLKCMVPGLLETTRNPESAAARFTCQLATPFGLCCRLLGVRFGASHGIGHQLGPLGVGHGETSCILMSAVHKWNASHGADLERQRLVCSTLWDIEIARQTFEARGLSPATADLGDLLDAFLRQIGMPRSLSVFGIGEDRFQEVAQNSMQDAYMATNPVPITEPRSVVEILQMCR